jgi:hypothetical protein
MINIVFCLLHPWKRTPVLVEEEVGWMGSTASLEALETRISYPTRIQTLDCSVHSTVTILIMLHWFPNSNKKNNRDNNTANVTEVFHNADIFYVISSYMENPVLEVISFKRGTLTLSVPH